MTHDAVSRTAEVNTMQENAKCPTEPNARAFARSGSVSTARRIMVVDDDIDFAETIAEILAANHYEVHTVNNSDDAVALMEQEYLPVALLDIRLGQNNGIELIRRLMEVRPGVLCVMMTAYAAIETTIMALQQGAYDYIRKPISAKELLSSLDRCFDRIRLEEEVHAAARELELRCQRQRSLLEAARLFAACTGIGQFYPLLLEQFLTVTEAEAGAIYVVKDDACQALCKQGAWGLPENVACPLAADDLALPVFEQDPCEVLLMTPPDGTVLGAPAGALGPGSLLFESRSDTASQNRFFVAAFKRSIFSSLDSEFVAMLLRIANETLRALCATEALRESEQRYRALTDHLPVGVYRHSGDLTGRFLVANPAFARICGFTTVEELLDKGIEEIFPDAEQREGLLLPPTSPETGTANELRLQRGTSDSVFVSAVPLEVRTQSGKIQYVDGVVQDITLRRKAEEQLKLDEMRLEALAQLSQMSDAPMQALTDFTLEEAVRLTSSKIGYLAFLNEDETVLTMHSWSRSAMHECAIQDKPILYPLETTGLWGEAVRQRKPMITNDYAAPNPCKRGYPEGHVQVQRHMNVPIFDGNHIVILAGVGNKESDYDSSDIRQLTLLMQGMWQMIIRHRSETAIRKLGVAVEQGGEAVLVADVTGRIEYANPAFERITGVPASEVNGADARALADTPEEAAFYQQIWEQVTDGATWKGQISTLHRDGSSLELDTVISPLRSTTGETTSIVGIFRDVTERVRLETQLRQSQKMEAIGQLAGGVAHDFNNLLQAIQGYTEMAVSDLPETTPVSTYLNEVLKASKRAATLVRQLLTFSRRQIFQPRPVDLNVVIAETMKMLRRLIGEHIELDLSPGPDLERVEADPGQIEQILMNLCVNARDAMPDGGRIAISTKNAYLDRAFCEQHPFSLEGHYVLMEVADTGVGMEPDVLEHIFEPFFTTKGVGEGTGLGLATVYGIVKQHDGIVLVNSVPGAGSVFRIYLPTSDQETDRPESAANEGKTNLAGSETVLLAEDDDVVRNMAVEVLRRAGYNVLVARDGEEAVNVFALNASAIDLVLLDVVMPRIGGPAACKRIRQTHPDMRFLYSSGYSADFVEGKSPALEDVPLIQKPYRAAELLQKVRETLSHRR